MDFRDLDKDIRALMTEEIEGDLAEGNLYISSRLTQEAAQAWPTWLREAADSGAPDSLAQTLADNGALRLTEWSQRGGQPYEKAVPVDAAAVLAQGEFNRFYMRAVCLHALSLEQPAVEVYRAKEVLNARSASQAMIGKSFPPQELLNDLRASVGTDTALGLPPGPNSGLSIRLISERQES